MFPDAKKFLGMSRLTELGAQLGARKQQLEKTLASKSDQAVNGPPTSRSNFKTGGQRKCVMESRGYWECHCRSSSSGT